jgi:hypothetical protein
VPPPADDVDEQLVAAAISDGAADGAAVGVSTPVTAEGSGSASDPHHQADNPQAAKPPIVFLCPNGHKLNAPASLQGKPGKCPHCGERFLVPMLDEPTEVNESAAFLDLLNDQTTAQPEPASTETPTDAAADSGFTFVGLAPEDEFAAGLIESSAQAMANLFARLWGQRGETGVVDLYLKGGEILSPHWYAPQLSRHAFGMFAFREQDGSHTLTAVHWDAIERIALRGIRQLPEGIFET